MKYIKLFEDYNKNTDNILNNILDKINNGEELTEEEKNILADISINDIPENALDWLDNKYGDLKLDIDTYNSFGKKIERTILYKNAEPYFEIDNNQNRVAYAEYDIFKKLSLLYNLSDQEISQILSDWLDKKFNILVREVRPLL